MNTLDDLWQIVRSIPKGKVMSYGDVGRLLRNPATGYQVGRWMANAPEGVPWWRVVAKSGQLPIAKRGPSLADEQMERLLKERVAFSTRGQVDMDKAAWQPD